jgi:hypothetical protein
VRYLVLGFQVFSLLTSCFALWYVIRQNKRSRELAEETMRLSSKLRDQARQARKIP